MYKKTSTNRNEVARLVNLMQAATDNEQPITVNITLQVFNGIMEYRAQQAIDSYKQEQERIAKENEQGDLVTPKEAKAMLHGISDATLWRYVKTGVVEKKQVGGKVYYSRKEIAKLMEGNA